MVSKTKFQYSKTEKSENQEEIYNGKHQCVIFGCPRIATIEINGRWNCRYHNLRAGNALDGITLILKNHEREIDWYEKVLTMAYHEYDKMKGNAPVAMLPHADDNLIQYRVRMQEYIATLLKNPARLKIPVTKTYADMSGGYDA